MKETSLSGGQLLAAGTADSGPTYRKNYEGTSQMFVPYVRCVIQSFAVDLSGKCSTSMWASVLQRLFMLACAPLAATDVCRSLILLERGKVTLEESQTRALPPSSGQAVWVLFHIISVFAGPHSQRLTPRRVAAKYSSCWMRPEIAPLVCSFRTGSRHKDCATFPLLVTCPSNESAICSQRGRSLYKPLPSSPL